MKMINCCIDSLFMCETSIIVLFIGLSWSRWLIELGRYIGSTHNRLIYLGANCGTIRTISNQWQSATSPCRCFRMRIVTKFT